MSADSNMIARLETLFYSLVSVARPMPIGAMLRRSLIFIRPLRQKPHQQPGATIKYARGYQSRRLGDMMRA